MTEIDSSQVSWQDQYKLMVGSVTPRPIALVTIASAALGVLAAIPLAIMRARRHGAL